MRNESPIKSKEDLSGARVCVTTGSTSVNILDEWNTGYLEKQGKKPAKPVLVDTRNDCLLELQEGTVDAYLGHDTFINPMLMQDPGLRAVPEGTVSHYGIAMNNDKQHNYFVQYVNGVLDELRGRRHPADPRAGVGAMTRVLRLASRSPPSCWSPPCARRLRTPRCTVPLDRCPAARRRAPQRRRPRRPRRRRRSAIRPRASHRRP